MKPKKQIDFLVEDFFNTGKIELNKNELGMTFDQLELLQEQNLESLQSINTLFDEGNEYKRKNNYPQAIKKWVEGIELYNNLGKPTILSVAVEDILPQIRNFSELIGREVPAVAIEDNIEVEEPIDTVEDEVEVEEIISSEEEEVEEEVDITSMQKEINKWKSVDLDDATIEVLEKSLPDPDSIEIYIERLEELKNKDHLNWEERSEHTFIKSAMRALNDQQKIVANIIINNPCIIHSVIYPSSNFIPLMEKLEKIFDKKVKSTRSK